MGQRLTLTDGEKIWRYFQRFAEYEDLKDLYMKCIPELINFEKKLIDFQNQLEQFNQIVYNFDEKLIQKHDKIAFKAYEIDQERNLVNKYVPKSSLHEFDELFKKH